MIIEKDISQLGAGSYVIEIVKQTGHFKIKNPGWVRDFHAIEKLISKGVLRVKVDTSKTIPADELESANDDQLTEVDSALLSENDKLDKNKTENSSVSDQVEKSKRSEAAKSKNLAVQIVEAKHLYDEAKSIQSKVLNDIQEGKPIDSSQVKDFTEQSIETIFENPDALACVMNIRCKDEYLLEHSVSVSILISIFGKFLKLKKSLINELAVGAFLHDVGKIKIPDKILNKPGKLTPEEFEEIKKHAVHSKNIVDQTNGISDLSRAIVANHHEKLDGTGYPRGLKSEQLSKYDRMITICDIYDALTADRVYKDGMAQIRAFAILRELASNGQLDAPLVDQFIRCLGVYPVGSLVKLSSEKLAIVESRNADNPTRPKVKAFFSLRNNVFTMAKEIDLSVAENEQIERGVRAGDFDLDMNKITEFLLMQG
ncbi:HD-GYP domain-containing protein [Aliikangiella coralliicola]|uniref:HD-GYP domain-containing protein n=1 Tax=Aliikangiella coralliicola TaxID=2592383 RepID=A0A545U4U1_9GAMM|nr:HD-GYP domain-containing protein [Aliikangiella coralliicola]TQV84491.1 HD-GYP domain-containing protein [Aliikangiella coralliicola]